MESVRVQVRFLQRQRIDLPSQQSRIASHFLHNVQKQVTKMAFVNNDVRCTVRVNPRSGLWIYHSRNDEGFESDSEHSDASVKSPRVQHVSSSSSSSAANSSISDIEDNDIPIGNGDGDFLIHARSEDILSCHIPSGFSCVVLLTLRCQDSLELVALECHTEGLARKISNACKILLGKKDPAVVEDAQETIPPPLEFADEREPPVPAHKPLVSIQSWSERTDDISTEHHHKPVVCKQNSKMQDLIRILERQDIHNIVCNGQSKPFKPSDLTSKTESAVSYEAAESSVPKAVKSCEKPPTAIDQSESSSPPRVQTSDNHLEKETRASARKPGKINPSVAREIEAVLQAQLQARRKPTVAHDFPTTVKKPQPPDITEVNKKVQEKPKTRSFLFKFVSDSSSSSLESDAGTGRREDRGRSAVRQKPAPSGKHRTPSQPPPSARCNDTNSSHTYFIPTKSGVDPGHHPYPKDCYKPGTKFLVPFPQPQPILVTGRPAPFAVRVPPYPGQRVKVPLQPAAPQLVYVQPMNQALVDEMKRRRSRSQSPGRRLLPRAPAQPPAANFAPLPIAMAAPPSPPRYRHPPKYREPGKQRMRVCEENFRRIRPGGPVPKDIHNSDCFCDPRKVTFNAFATVQLVD